jgi:hypothetical protein
MFITDLIGTVYLNNSTLAIREAPAHSCTLYVTSHFCVEMSFDSIFLLYIEFEFI